MLTSLFVKDFAIASEVELTLGDGLTVVSGETGAGKSLLVDALMLLCGARADAGVVRHGCDRAELAADFAIEADSDAVRWLQEQALDDDTSCQLRRVIRADGGSRGWINGRPATLGQIGELAALLVEIHGQHEHQALLERGHQLALLDANAGHAELLDRVATAARAWQSLATRRAKVAGSATDPGPRIDYLRHQIQELEAEAIDADAFDALLVNHRRQAHVTDLLQCCERAQVLLDGEDGRPLTRAARAVQTDLLRQAEHDSRLTEAAGLIETAALQLDEAAALIVRVRDELDIEPERLQALDAQLGRLHDLARKHRTEPRLLKSTLEQLRAELEELEQAGTALIRIDAELETLARQWREAATALGASRAAAAAELGEAVTALMAELGMSGGSFVVQLQALEDTTPSLSGAERAEFLVAANAGQPARALRKTASGGELSRISLAIEVATLGKETVQTMVFDEVDSGIGGAVAEIVGQKLRALGRHRQVLCVTHLPQVAAQGHRHLSVSKHEVEGATRSEVSALDEKGRVEEIARMLGGVEITAATRSNARQLLKGARDG